MSKVARVSRTSIMPKGSSARSKPFGSKMTCPCAAGYAREGRDFARPGSGVPGCFEPSSSSLLSTPPRRSRAETDLPVLIGRSTSTGISARSWRSAVMRATDRASRRGGLRLDRKPTAFKGGGSGPVIVPRKADESLVVRRSAGLEEDRVMPPKGERLAFQQVAALRAWIDQGAEWPGTDGGEDGRDRWSLRLLNRPAVLALAPGARAGAHNPIDAFVRAKLREKGLAPSPEADRRTLARRLYFDLLGLSPAPIESDQDSTDRQRACVLYRDHPRPSRGAE